MTYYKKHISEESGQGLVEYSLILSLFAIAIVIVVKEFGDSVNIIYETITDILNIL